MYKFSHLSDSLIDGHFEFFASYVPTLPLISLGLFLIKHGEDKTFTFPKVKSREILFAFVGVNNNFPPHQHLNVK